MRGSILSSAILAATVAGTWARGVAAYTPATDATTQVETTQVEPAAVPTAQGAAAHSATAYVAPSDSAAPAPRERLSVEKVQSSHGLLFYPSVPEKAGTFRFALGASYDALDPEVMYGMTVRFPQLTLDGVDWLGGGWSFKSHLNTMLVMNELLVGAGYAWHAQPLSVELAFSAGVYLGTVGAIVGSSGVAGFNALFVSPEYRPELTLGWDFGKIAVSLRGTLLLMGPMRAKVGSVWGGFDNANAFAGHSEMLYVENTTRGSSVWYFGAGAMTTRAYYALWVLFPDSPSLYTYPRLVVGYEY
jgi:hypothetical protein